MALVSPATAQLENGKRVTNMHSHLFVAAQATLLANTLNTVKKYCFSLASKPVADAHCAVLFIQNFLYSMTHKQHQMQRYAGAPLIRHRTHSY